MSGLELEEDKLGALPLDLVMMITHPWLQLVEIGLANCGGAYPPSSCVLLPPTTPKHTRGIIGAKGLLMGIFLPGGLVTSSLHLMEAVKLVTQAW